MTQKEKKDLVLVDGKLVPAGEVPAGDCRAGSKMVGTEAPPVEPLETPLADGPHKVLEPLAAQLEQKRLELERKVKREMGPGIPFSEFGQPERQLITHEQPYKLEFHRSAKGDPHWVITIHAETSLKMIRETEQADEYLMGKYRSPAAIVGGEPAEGEKSDAE